MKYILLTFTVVLLLVAGQVLFRLGVDGKNFGSILETINVLFTPIVVAGLSIYVLSTMLWLYVLTRVPISQAYPMLALAYPIMLVFARYLFSEEVSLIRWIGAIIICVGVVLIAQ